MSSDERRCPVCAATMAPVAFGLPSHEMFQAADRGEIVLGGCIVDGDAPVWACPERHGRWTDGRR